MKKAFSVIAQKTAIEVKRNGKIFLTLPMAFEVNGTKYSPSLFEKRKDKYVYADGIATVAVVIYDEFFTVRASLKVENEELAVEDIAASFTETVVEAVRSKVGEALKRTGYNKMVMAGGVSANSHLRAGITEECKKFGAEFYAPTLNLCGDNAAMIGAAAYYEYINGARAGWDLNAVPNLKLGER